MRQRLTQAPVGAVLLALGSLLRPVAAATFLRSGGVALAVKPTQRVCGPEVAAQIVKLLQAGQKELPAHPTLGARGRVTSDGFSRVACDVDVAPEAQRVHFKDFACGEEGVTCRLTELGMTPRICFDFCRQYENARFFGLQGQDCYCSTYFEAKSLGGDDGCTFHCEGDSKELCGGPDRSSLFEMHMCGDSLSEASEAATLAVKAYNEAGAVVSSGDATVVGLQNLAHDFHLPVCTITPQGPLACDLPGQLAARAGPLNMEVTKANHSMMVLHSLRETMQFSARTMSSEGPAFTAEQASATELTTRKVVDAAATLQGDVAAMNMTLNSLAGPLFGPPLDAASFQVFTRLVGEDAGNSHTFCALKPVAGAFYAAMSDAATAPAKCASKCLSLSSGTDMCIAFNLQAKDGLVACQLLTKTGLLQTQVEFRKAIPVFRVAQKKRDAMGLQALECYAMLSSLPARGPLLQTELEAIAE